MRLAVVLAVVLVACGGRPTEVTAGVSEQTACDYCPGAASVTTTTRPNSVMTTCKCASSPNPPGTYDALSFQTAPPLRECAHYQCEFAFICANGGPPFNNECP